MEFKEMLKEIEKHLLEDVAPSEYITELFKREDVKKDERLSMLERQKDVPQSPKHHPEGSVWNHTMMVIDNATRYRDITTNPKRLMWSALLHDLGKLTTTRKKHGRIISYDHDREGEKMVYKFFKDSEMEPLLIDDIAKYVRWHMHCLYVTKDLPFSNVPQMVKEVDYKDLSLLCLSDILGRGGLTKEMIKEKEETIELFKRKIEKQMSE